MSKGKKTETHLGWETPPRKPKKTLDFFEYGDLLDEEIVSYKKKNSPSKENKRRKTQNKPKPGNISATPLNSKVNKSQITNRAGNKARKTKLMTESILDYFTVSSTPNSNKRKRGSEDLDSLDITPLPKRRSTDEHNQGSLDTSAPRVYHRKSSYLESLRMSRDKSDSSFTMSFIDSGEESEKDDEELTNIKEKKEESPTDTTQAELTRLHDDFSELDGYELCIE